MNDTNSTDMLSVNDVEHIISDESSNVDNDLLSRIPYSISSDLLLELMRKYVPICSATTE